MSVFISWSGERSKKLADALHNFLGNVLPGIDLWFSDEDIGPGAIWSDQLRQALQQANVGVL